MTALDRRTDRLIEKMKSFGKWTAVGFGVAAAGAYKLVEAASAAEESLNVLRQTFKENAGGVERWSRDLGKAMGRSEFTLQESVGRFGAFLAPVFKDANVDIAQMSERLSELAVDLASFYNTSDAEAIMRLFSGISGETEAVRRLGINISDSSLAELAKKQGDTRDYNTLTLAEKTALRFKKIIIDTENVQGDAVRTAGEWANSLKRVQEKMKTFAVALGRVIKKFALPMLHVFEKVFDSTQKGMLALIKNTHVLETALWLAAGAAGALAAEFVTMKLALPGMIPLLVAGLKAAAISAAKIAAAFVVFLVIEDVVTFMKDGDSILNSWLKSVTGMSRPLGLVENAFQRIAIGINNAWARTKALFFQLQAVSLLAAGNTTGAAVATANAAAAGAEVVDAGVMQKKKSRVNEEMFQDLVRNGGNEALNEAASKYHMDAESPEAAFDRAVRTRKQLVASGEVKPLPGEVAGFGFKLPFVTPQSRESPLGDPITQPTATPGFNVRVPFAPGASTTQKPVVIQKVEVVVKSEIDAKKAGAAWVEGMLMDADRDASDGMPEPGGED